MSLIPLDEAAKFLGVSTEDLKALRSNGEISGLRDGKTWKFKQSELERYKSMQSPVVTDLTPMASESAILSSSSLEIDADLDILEDVGSQGSIPSEDDVIEDASVGVQSSSSSTIIGAPKIAATEDSEELIDLRDGNVAEDDDSKLSLAGDSELKLDMGSEINLVGAADQDGAGLALESDSQINLVGDSSDQDLIIDDDSDLKLESDVSGINLADGSGLQLDLGASDLFLDDDAGTDGDAGATGVLPNVAAAAASDFDLGDVTLDDGDALNLQLNLSDEDLELSIGSSSEISLEGSDLSLAPSDTGVSIGDDSDVTMNASESGINLDSPSDSGIALDSTPQEINMANESLELGDADLVDLGSGILDGENLMEDDFQADDDFLLSPSATDLGDDDSGSQVIALDTDDFSDDAAPLMEGDDDDLDAMGAGDDVSPMAPLARVAAPADYTILNVLALGMIVTLLGITGLFTMDLVRNMWSWQGEYAINSPIMDFILSPFQ